MAREELSILTRYVTVSAVISFGPLAYVGVGSSLLYNLARFVPYVVVRETVRQQSVCLSMCVCVYVCVFGLNTKQSCSKISDISGIKKPLRRNVYHC